MPMSKQAPRYARKLLVLAAVLAAGAAQAQATYSGFLCCNMRTDGAWISDINYAENGKRVIPAGTPVTITGYGRYRVNTTMAGQRQDLGNDYSRDLDLENFAKRYVVTADPKAALAKASPRIRKAVETQRLVKGMTREQVIMSQGYPIASETPSLDSRVWKYWRSRGEEFHVVFNRRGVVEAVRADDPNLRARVTAR